MSELVESALEGRLLRITLNRPGKRNALNIPLCRALAEELDRADVNRHIGAVLLAANGPAFCAGMDLNEMSAGPDLDEMNEAHEQLFTFGARITKPVVAAVDGPALAGGTGLVANCHIVVASQSATFGLTEIRLALWPFVVYRAVALAAGERRALELSLTGRIFGTQEALQWGIVHHVAPAFELDGRAWSVASGIASSPAGAIRRGMAFTHETRGMDWTRAGELALRYRAEAFGSAEFREAVRAFRGKR